MFTLRQNILKHYECYLICIYNELKFSNNNFCCYVKPKIKFQVNSALTLDHTQSQWVDLGIHIEACMTRPETCGSAGGAISVWLKVIDCPYGGIISSHSHSTGSVIYCTATDFRYDFKKINCNCHTFSDDFN